MASDTVKRCRPAPVALEIPEEEIADRPQPALRVKNTFIESAALLSPSFELFYREREVHTCPANRAGRLATLLDEAVLQMGVAADITSATPQNIQTPCNMDMPLADSLLPWVAALMPGAMLPPPPPYLPPRSLGSQGSEAAAGVALQEPSAHSGPRTLLSLEGALGAEIAALPPYCGGGGGFPVLQQLAPFTANAVPASGSTSLVTVEDLHARCLRPPPPPPLPPRGPAPGSAELPSVGSAGHARGSCKPCAFMHTKGCTSGPACKFCHLCNAEEQRMRRKVKVQQQREAHRAREEKRAAAAAAAAAADAVTAAA